MTLADDGSVASLSPLLTDPRIQSLAGLGDLLIYRSELSTGLTVWTPALLKRWGYAVDAVSKSDKWWMERTHPDDAPALGALLQESLDGQRDEWALSYRFRKADGSWARVEGHARIVRDAQGRPIATEGVVRDVTPMYEVEEALRTSEALFRLLTENSRELVCRHDADGTYRYASPAITELTQWTPADLVGKSPYEFFHPEDRERISSESHVLALAGQLDSVGIVYRFRCRDDSYRWLETLTRPLLDDAGEVIGLQTSSRDVTDRRLLEERLAQSQKMDAIGLLAGGVAHEFNNLLTVASANLDLLLAETPDAHAHALQAEALAAVTGAAVLTKQLMTLGRRELPQREPVDLCATLHRMTPMLRRLAGTRADVQVDVIGDAWVSGSHTQVEQLVFNLVANARDAQPDGGQIAVRGETTTLPEPYAAQLGSVPAGHWVRLTIEDSGPGVARGVLERMLEPFFSTKEAGTVLGLGLSTVQSIVAEMGGHFTVETAQDKGTVVTCWLPPAARPDYATPDGTPITRSDRADKPPRSSCHVLIVDDDPAVLKVAHRVLDRLGFQVTAAHGAPKALELIAEGTVPDVLLTDVTMPEISGPELARRLHAQFPSMPIAFVSGYAREELLTDGLIGEEFPLVHKPFVAADLRDVIERLRAKTVPDDQVSNARP